MSSLSIQYSNKDGYREFVERYANTSFQGVRKFYWFIDESDSSEIMKRVFTPVIASLISRPVVARLVNVFIPGDEGLNRGDAIGAILGVAIGSIHSGIKTHKAYYTWADDLNQILWTQLFKEHEDMLKPFRDSLTYQTVKDPVYVRGNPKTFYGRKSLLQYASTSSDGKDPLHIAVVTEKTIIPDIITFSSLSRDCFSLILEDLKEAKNDALRKKGLKILFFDLKQQIENFLEKCSNFDQRFKKGEISKPELAAWNTFKNECSQITHI